jgi:HECT-domain (ubiquitin-transferase)
MFCIDEDSGMAWFSPLSNASLATFELVGILMGIGLLNGLILPVCFPRYFYERLQGREMNGIESLHDGWPSLYRGLRTLLSFEEKPEGPSFEDTFGLETVLTQARYGVYRDWDYINGGKRFWSIRPKQEVIKGDFRPQPLTLDNRLGYIQAQLNYLLHDSIKRQFAALQKGLFAVVDEKMLGIVHPHTLKSIVEGEEDFKVEELEQMATYANKDFGPQHQTVRWFWEVLKEYEPELKKGFLKFMFGTDRIAAQSLRFVSFSIESYSTSEYPRPQAQEYLPTVSSCFGILRLPEYHSKELLKKKLTMALENCEGFGLA